MPNESRSRYLKVFFYASVFWIVVGVLHLGSLYLEDLQWHRLTSPSKEQWALFISAYFTWSFLTTFIYFLIEKCPPNKENFRWMLWLALVALGWVLLTAIIRQYLASFLWGNPNVGIISILLSESPFLYVFNFLKVLLAYGVCTGIFYYLRVQEAQLALVEVQREAAAIREQQARFQLQALQSQLSPHFLFNCLNSVSSLARGNDNAKIIKTLAHLADLLRYALEGADKKQVILEDELAFADNYIFLQSLRFDGCFDYKVQLQLVDRFVFCPPFCIQTLIENVFSHNDLTSSKPIAIRVSVKNDAGWLVISVENSPSISTQNTGVGIGLDNLRDRIRLIYGEKAQLVIHESPPIFLVTLMLPVVQNDD